MNETGHFNHFHYRMQAIRSSDGTSVEIAGSFSLIGEKTHSS